MLQKLKEFSKFSKQRNFVRCSVSCLMSERHLEISVCNFKVINSSLHVGRKIEATLADLEVLKPRLLSQPLNAKLSQAHYQLKFGANYYPVTGILKFGKDLKQEVKLLTNRSTENLDETFSSFIAATTILVCLVCCYLGMLLLLS